MTVIFFKGNSAFSGYQVKRLEENLKQIDQNVESLKACFVYVVASDKSLSKQQADKLANLLHANHFMISDNGADFWTIARKGTISPWSTKSLDILRNCGIDYINRLEKAIQWSISIKTKNKSTHCLVESDLQKFAAMLYDKMTESLINNHNDFQSFFDTPQKTKLATINVIDESRQALDTANSELGLALNEQEIDYLLKISKKSKRNFSDAELMMFSQINSEHCRHKIFNASWNVDGEEKESSLFAMIKHTHKQNPKGTLIAYHDNSAVLNGSNTKRFFADHNSGTYQYHEEPAHIIIKVETHNHPTAISPYQGAATGSGGEIRDEGATGKGSKPKAGVTGFTVSNLHIPTFPKAWEGQANNPDHLACPLKIMLDGPIGAASFNNEFGRPCIGGYFRTFEQSIENSMQHRYGYHKPIMIAGGLGNIRDEDVNKIKFNAQAKLIVLGGPAMLIGLGGGAASSVSSGQIDSQLDFASVQRANPEMQRRCQEVIDACWAMGDNNPILSIHDVGAGGLSNAIPELIHDAELGGEIQLDLIPNDDPSMSPMQIWCNEAQERYVLSVDETALPLFQEICQRERCLYSVIGEATQTPTLILNDGYQDADNTDKGQPINISMKDLFANPPKMHRTVTSEEKQIIELELKKVSIDDAIERLLTFPAIADKTFLITIGDRSVTGMICRDQMVGKWQVPVADVGVTANGFTSYLGEAIAMGERTPLACLNAPASGRIAVGEVITNIAAAAIDKIEDIKLSANWMTAAGSPGQDADLYNTVEAIGLGLCPELGLSIPVGKDSMSMKTQWQDQQSSNSVTSPLSLIVTGVAPVNDVRKTLTPVLDTQSPSMLLLIDLGQGRNRLGGSSLAQVFNKTGIQTPDVNDAAHLKSFFNLIQQLNKQNLISAYHDRSDGGMFVSLCEMAFASRCGLEINLDELSADAISVLFTEELGAIIQIKSTDHEQVLSLCKQHKLEKHCYRVARICKSNDISISRGDEILYSTTRVKLHRLWSKTSWQMQRLRDNPDCADQEYERILDENDPGLFADVRFKYDDSLIRVYPKTNRPKIAILRVQGVNGQLEMAAAFDRAGFSAIDVHMSDLLENRINLNEFVGLAACGGFSFGDVLGAGTGWAKTILYNPKLKDLFENFFNRNDVFSLGVCNGCQMMSQLKSLIPGAHMWPQFDHNASQQYEARQVMIQVDKSPSILFADMAGSSFPVAIAHGEGRAMFENTKQQRQAIEHNILSLKYIDNKAKVSMDYPYNPNGSSEAIAALTSLDGRATIMMPHPERVFRSVLNSWHPIKWQENSPWMRIFQNARRWVD